MGCIVACIFFPAVFIFTKLGHLRAAIDAEKFEKFNLTSKDSPASVGGGGIAPR